MIETDGQAGSFAAQLREIMADRKISGNALARLVFVDPALICRLRSGKQRPSERMAKAVDDALGAGGALMALGPGRRAVLAGGLAGLAAIVGPELADRLDWTARHAAGIDMAAADSLADVLASQRRAEDAIGAAAVLRPTMAQLAVVENLARQARGPMRLPVLNVGQQWAQFASHLCRHAGDVPAARACGAQALEWAEELGDRSMISTLLLSRGYLAAEAGEIGAMIGLAQGAQRDTRAATGQLADAAGFEARGLAMAGDSAAAERKLGEARDLAATLADRPQDQRSWSYWLNPAVFVNEEGITCAYLAGDPRWHRRAVELLAVKPDETALWAAAKNLTWLAFAHAQADDVGQACATALQASTAVRRTGSVPHAATLTQISADLTARHPADQRVVELADALAA
jgi:transcriptional regulator with XRE-family HTH domain